MEYRMKIWILWWNMIWQLRPACSHIRTFMWMASAVAGMILRAEHLGVTSFVRTLGLRPKCYQSFLDMFHSNALKLERLTILFRAARLEVFPAPIAG